MLTGAMCISMASTAFAAESKSLLSASESWTDEDGNQLELVYSVDDSSPNADSHAALYVNGVLIQESYASPKENVVKEYDYSVSLMGDKSNRPRVQEYVYSELVQNINTLTTDDIVEYEADSNISAYVSVPFPKFYPEGWSLVERWDAAASANPYAISLYASNVDEEPDLHPFEKKEISFAAKVAATTIAAVLGQFILTGAITIAIVLKAFGAALIKEGTQYVLNKSVKGTVCYSTQKVRYAPVVEGYNIYPSAYITKLWMVAGNAYTGGKNFTLAQEAYEYSPQGSTTDLMYAARRYFTDWAQQNGYV